MYSIITPQVFHSNKTFERKSKVFKGTSKLHGHQGSLQMNLGSPFRVLLDVDLDAETPSPLSIYFDLPQSTSSTSKMQWAGSDLDSDLDSDTESERDISDLQYITIPFGSPFYCPPTPPTFQTSFFDLPPVGYVPVACQALKGDSSKSAVEIFRAELERITQAEVEKDFSRTDDDCMRGTNEQLWPCPITLSLPSMGSGQQRPAVPEDSSKQ
ncbi:hypothetical protein DFH07DRAFT_91333 [Mycena maculata]|uniref:Uncharacterized protein n=1 Tax=Mycena maculata TaxID=230809 RepID=A0AAD7MZR2_9AGAR|nr:hypothetical protein DFH07DRAFT_91333 [Mycena maculata]